MFAAPFFPLLIAETVFAIVVGKFAYIIAVGISVWCEGCGCGEEGRRKNQGGEGGGGKQRFAAEGNSRKEA